MGSVSWKGIYRLHRAVSGMLRDCNGCQHSGRSLWLSGHVLHNAPYYPTTQPFFFNGLLNNFGIMAGDLAYIAAIIMGRFLFFISFTVITGKTEKQPYNDMPVSF